MKTRQLALIEAATMGYKYKDGNVYSPKGKIRKLQFTTTGYYCFSIKYNKKVINIPVHRLSAYQKFGNRIFEEKIMVRHLDGNPLNNHPDNIELGTALDNWNDIPLEKRQELASRTQVGQPGNACSKKHNHEAILKMRQEGAKFGAIMKAFNISSKGTLSFILNSSLAKEQS